MGRACIEADVVQSSDGGLFSVHPKHLKTLTGNPAVQAMLPLCCLCEMLHGAKHVNAVALLPSPMQNAEALASLIS